MTLQFQDLDNAAEAGLELNKMLSEVLASQNGDEAFMSTVDELQRQLNEQESKYTLFLKRIRTIYLHHFAPQRLYLKSTQAWRRRAVKIANFNTLSRKPKRVLPAS